MWVVHSWSVMLLLRFVTSVTCRSYHSMGLHLVEADKLGIGANIVNCRVSGLNAFRSDYKVFVAQVDQHIL